MQLPLQVACVGVVVFGIVGGVTIILGIAMAVFHIKRNKIKPFFTSNSAHPSSANAAGSSSNSRPDSSAQQPQSAGATPRFQHRQVASAGLNPQRIQVTPSSAVASSSTS